MKHIGEIKRQGVRLLDYVDRAERFQRLGALKKACSYVGKLLQKLSIFIGVALAALLQLNAAVFDVRTFGAKGDGITKDTKAIQKAINAAHSAGGGEVFLGAGVYLSGSIFLKSNVDFHLGAGAILKASPDKEDYNKADICPQNWTSKAESHQGAHLILCIEEENVTVRGPGKIDGNSSKFLLDPKTNRTWGFKLMSRASGQGEIPWRPAQMLYFVESRNIRVMDMELADSPYWTLFLHGCEHVSLRGLYIHNERDRYHTHNGDGIDIDSCQFVTVLDCRIRTADDCITLRADGRKLKQKRGCAYITVANSILSSPCNAVRVGVGDGEVHDATFTGISVHDTRTAINFVSSWKDNAIKGVDFRNIHFSNWTVDCRYLFIIDSGPLAKGVRRKSNARDILFSDFSGRSFFGGCIHGSPFGEWRNIVLRNINIPVGVDIKNADVDISGGSVYAKSSRPVFDVRESGARGNGDAVDTLAIQKAIDKAYSSGGGTVLFPEGTYLSGEVFLKSEVKLEFKKGATLKAIADNASGRSLVVATNCVNITLAGAGCIDGSSLKDSAALSIAGSRNIAIEGLTLIGSAGGTCSFLGNEKLGIQDSIVRNHSGAGIGVDACRDVFMTRCDIDTDGNCVTLRASDDSLPPCECRNVRIERCRLSSRRYAIYKSGDEGAIRDCHFSLNDICKVATAADDDVLDRLYSENEGR